MIGVQSGFGHSNKKRLLLFASAAAFAVVCIIAGYFAWQFFSLKNNPDKTNEETIGRLTTAVGEIYSLPADEEPTVAQIQDKEKLKDQSFFDKAQVGDYLLVYAEERLALIYREEEGKLINVGPISTEGNGQEQVLPESDKQ